MKFLNIAAYKFIALNELPTLRTTLKARASALDLRGTILLSREGINLMLVGLEANIATFQAYLAKDPKFADLTYKTSFSDNFTFNRLLVKIKKEIIAFGVSSIDPVHQKAPYVSPETLKQWLDEKRDIILLDTRNDYEIDAGTFLKAKNLPISHFRDFPKALQTLDPALKQKTIVTFCTGGIRCEKAALLMQQQGFNHVFQLEGGILNYFEKCQNAHYEGECFVFDKRVGLDSTLQERKSND